MKLKQLKRKRHIIHKGELTSDNPGSLVFEGSEYEAHKLQIWRRDTSDLDGEVNFLIREKENNLKYILVYCFIPEPGQINRICFWICNKVQLPSGEIATVAQLIDQEKASYFVMDFTERYLKKNYTFVSESLQQI